MSALKLKMIPSISRLIPSRNTNFVRRGLATVKIAEPKKKTFKLQLLIGVRKEELINVLKYQQNNTLYSEAII